MKITRGETTIHIPGWLMLVGVIGVVDVVTAISNAVVAKKSIK